MLTRTVAFLAILALGTTLATADIISQTLPFTGTPNYTRTLTFNQFDDQGGTLVLQSIEVIVTLNAAGGQLILDNDGEDPAVGNFEFGAKGDIASTDVALIKTGGQPVTAELAAIHGPTPFNLDGNVGDAANDFDPSPPDGMQYNGGSETDGDNGFIDAAVFGQYTGTSTYDIDAVVTQWSDFGGVSGIEWAVTPVTANGDVTVPHLCFRQVGLL